MDSFWPTFLDAISATPMLEWIAVICAIAYVILAAHQHIACWAAAAVSVAIYTYLCATAQLYLETGLQLFYLFMAGYGYMVWQRHKTNVASNQLLDAPQGDATDRKQIVQWSPRIHLIAIAACTGLTLLAGFGFQQLGSQNAYLDAFTTVFSLFATYLVAQKVLENWLYWIAIDFAAIFLYASRDLALTAVLYLVYTIIAVFGYLKWRKQLIAQPL